MRLQAQFPVTMRTTPTMSVASGNAYFEKWQSAGYYDTVTITYTSGNNEEVADFSVQPTTDRGFVYGDPAMLGRKYIKCDAEL